MKKYILILLMLPVLAIKAQEAPKRTNTIVVQCTISSPDSIVIAKLKALGYRVANDGYGGITTIPRMFEHYGQVQINVDVKDSTVSISGLFGQTTAYEIITPELYKNKETYGGHWLGGFAMNKLIEFSNLIPHTSYRFIAK